MSRVTHEENAMEKPTFDPDNALLESPAGAYLKAPGLLYGARRLPDFSGFTSRRRRTRRSDGKV